MAGRGAAPKPQLTRPNDQARRDAATTRLSADGQVRGPELPDGDWHPRTVEWWQHWRESPQAQVMTTTDWDVLAETAIFHSRLWNGEVSVGPELRLRVAKFGATVEDRLRLRMQVEVEVKEAAKPAGTVTKDRRRRLLKAVANGPA
jgi:hypothetical protein